MSIPEVQLVRRVLVVPPSKTNSVRNHTGRLVHLNPLYPLKMADAIPDNSSFCAHIFPERVRTAAPVTLC